MTRVMLAPPPILKQSGGAVWPSGCDATLPRPRLIFAGVRPHPVLMRVPGLLEPIPASAHQRRGETGQIPSPSHTHTRRSFTHTYRLQASFREHASVTHVINTTLSLELNIRPQAGGTPLDNPRPPVTQCGGITSDLGYSFFSELFLFK